MSATGGKALALHLGVIALLFALHFVLPPYHHTNLARVMVLAVFAMGYNITFGYTGMLSLGHALFFASGLYATGLLIEHGAWTAGPGLIAVLDLGAVELPDWHPRAADRTCLIQGFAIEHPDGVIVFDTGTSDDNERLNGMYRPVVTPIVEALNAAGIDERQVVAIVNSHPLAGPSAR